MLTLLSPEKYALVLAEESSKLPPPPRCGQHTNYVTNGPTCVECRLYRNWAARMNTRFNRRGFSFRPAAVHEPEEPKCANRDHVSARAHYHDCDDCHKIVNWRKREAERRIQESGKPLSFTDIPRLADHVRKLEAAGVPAVEIADQVGVNGRTVRQLTTRPPRWVRTSFAEAVLAIPVPDRVRLLVPDARGWVRRRIDSTGSRRRVQAAAMNGHSVSAQAEMLGWSRFTMKRWLYEGDRATSISIDAADDVAALYPRLMEHRGDNNIAISMARRRGWLEGRYFSEANIDDPRYDPFEVIERPYGLRRRLQALAWIAHGPEEVAELIGEPVDQVRSWMLGAPAPAYADHLVVPVYERLSFTSGTDQEAADLARHRGWVSPLAWDDVNMDDRQARPSVDLPKGVSKLYLTSTVFDAIDGRIPASQLLKPEKVQVLWVLHKRGWSDRRIAAWLRWNKDGDIDAGAKAVCRYRTREGIVGYGPVDDSADARLILLGAAA